MNDGSASLAVENILSEDEVEKKLNSVSDVNTFLRAAMAKGYGPHIHSKIFDLLGFNQVDFNSIKVILTFEDMQPMIFVFSRQLSQAKTDNQQSWLGMTDDEIKANTYEYNVRYLGELLKTEPINIPNYPTAVDGALKSNFIKYFLTFENKALFRFVHTAYINKQYPKELM